MRGVNSVARVIFGRRSINGGPSFRSISRLAHMVKGIGRRRSDPKRQQRIIETVLHGAVDEKEAVAAWYRYVKA